MKLDDLETNFHFIIPSGFVAFFICCNIMLWSRMALQEFYCTICKKQLPGEGEYDAHLKSEEHAIAEVSKLLPCFLVKFFLSFSERINIWYTQSIKITQK